MTQRFPRLLTLALLLSALTACGGDDVIPPPDTDGGSTDAGARDGAADGGGARVDGGGTDVDAGACTDEDGDGRGALPCGDDCDDADATRFPGNAETCDDDDEDCNDSTYGPDGDSDGFPSVTCCNGADNCGADCNDVLNTVNPGAAEQCNGGVDDDCDGLADAADGVCVPCPTGYAGFDGGCVDLNECAVSGFCGTGGTACVNSAGTFSCSCGPGFFAAAPTGAQCEDFDECAAATGPCGALGSCTNTVGSYSCGCPPGYVAGAGGCVNVNECTTNPCGPTSTMCTDTPGSYTCTCVTGYAAGGPGGGGTCADVDECAIGTCGAGSSACSNFVGTFSCTCRAGYRSSGPGAPCLDVDECAAGMCGPGVASCTNTAGSYACTCAPGYTVASSGAPCVDTNECATGAPCGAGLGTCANRPGSYACTCNPGYGAPATGGTCSELNECVLGTDDCTDAPAGICTNTAGSFTCACAPGFPFGTRTARGALGCLVRFTDLGDGTVRDNRSGLVWQQGFSPGEQAQAASVTYCTSLTLGGGWRLPTKDELLSIVDSSRSNPSIDTAFFPGTPSTWFWSSSPVAGSPSVGWYVYFSSGNANVYDATSMYRARCVR